MLQFESRRRDMRRAGTGPGTFGSDLAAALTGLRPSPVARAAGLLHHVLLGNPECKRKLLEATSSGGAGSEGSLLSRSCGQLSNMLASGQQGLILPRASLPASSACPAFVSLSIPCNVAAVLQQGVQPRGGMYLCPFS